MDRGATPRFTDHARERCAEMGISTKVAKRIWREQTCSYPDPERAGPRQIVTAATVPEYAIVVDVESPDPVVVTVLFNVPERYERAGAEYRVIEDEQVVE